MLSIFTLICKQSPELFLILHSCNSDLICSGCHTETPRMSGGRVDPDISGVQGSSQCEQIDTCLLAMALFPACTQLSFLPNPTCGEQVWWGGSVSAQCSLALSCFLQRCWTHPGEPTFMRLPRPHPPRAVLPNTVSLGWHFYLGVLGTQTQVCNRLYP